MSLIAGRRGLMRKLVDRRGRLLVTPEVDDKRLVPEITVQSTGMALSNDGQEPKWIPFPQTSDIPEPQDGDEGKVLTVDDDLTLYWGQSSTPPIPPTPFTVLEIEGGGYPTGSSKSIEITQEQYEYIQSGKQFIVSMEIPAVGLTTHVKPLFVVYASAVDSDDVVTNVYSSNLIYGIDDSDDIRFIIASAEKITIGEPYYVLLLTVITIGGATNESIIGS